MHGLPSLGWGGNGFINRDFRRGGGGGEGGRERKETKTVVCMFDHEEHDCDLRRVANVCHGVG